jgi:alpha-L-fucosidase
MPAECDVPLRKGWFFHPEENSTVKNPQQLFDLYLKSVGRGGCLDIGIAPDTRGLLHENDVVALAGFGSLVRQTFAVNLARKASFRASQVRGGASRKFGTTNLTDEDRYSYWATDDSVHTPELELQWGQSQLVRFIRLRENIKLGQRIEGLAVDAWQAGKWVEIAAATSIGASRIIALPNPVTTEKLRIRITRCPVAVALSEVGVF